MAKPAELVLSIARSLVDHPEAVKTRWVESEKGNYVEISVVPGDRGKIIGRQGRTIQSIRDLLTAAYAENDGKVGAEIHE